MATTDDYLEANRSASIAKVLIGAGADVNKPLNAAELSLPEGTTPLHVAAWIGNEELVRTLIEAGADVNARDVNGTSAVQLGARSEDVARRLIRAGADPEGASADRHFDNERAYTEAGRSASLAKMLIDAGADVNKPVSLDDVNLPDGTTVLHVAARGENAELVQTLINAGADVNARDADGRTALHHLHADASRWQSGWTDANKKEAEQAVGALTAAGADPHIVDERGISALNLMIDAGTAIGARSVAPERSAPTSKDTSLNPDQAEPTIEPEAAPGIDSEPQAAAPAAQAPKDVDLTPDLGNTVERGVDDRFIAELDEKMAKAELSELGWRDRDDIDDVMQDLEVLAGQDWRAAAELWEKYLPDRNDKPAFLEARERDDEDAGRDDGANTKGDPDAAAAKSPDALDALRKRFLEADNKFYFRDSQELAFEDAGSRMKAKTDDPEVAKSMVHLAESKGWSSLKVKGTDDFKRAVWLEASLRGMEVKGYKARDVDLAKLAELKAEREKDGNFIERMQPSQGRSEDRATGRDSASDRMPVDEQRAVLTDKQRASVEALERILRERGDSEKAIAMAVDLASERFNTDRVYVGRVLEHGAAPYEFDEKKADNYFVKIQSPKGEKIVWGVDLERAMSEGGVKVGDDVALAYQGRQPVTVPTKELDAQGKETGRMVEITTHRNTWDVNQLDKLRDEVRERLAEKAAKTDRQQPLVKVYDRDAPRATERIVTPMEPAREQDRARA